MAIRESRVLPAMTLPPQPPSQAPDERLRQHSSGPIGQWSWVSGSQKSTRVQAGLRSRNTEV